MAKLKDTKKEKHMKIASVVVGLVLMITGLVLLMVSAPETITDETAGCGADGICNCKCEEEPDSDCTSLGQTLSVVLMVLAIIIGVMPVAVYEYFKYSRFKRMEDSFPRFMKDFSEAVKGGMTIPQALNMTAKIDYGDLSKEIKKTDNQVSWGLPFPKAMLRFADRIKGSSVMKQSFTIINESFKSGGDIANTMNSIAMNIGLIRDIEDEKNSIMSQQIYIMYFIFFMFLGIVVLLYKLIVPMLSINFSKPGEPLDPSANCDVLGLPSSTMCTIGRAFGLGCEHVYFVSLFLFMCIIQGISSGILAGVIGQGRVVAGIKHAAIMVIATVCVFVIFL
ncbi:MAG: type II secretion system F family protein [archaeon]|nr:type II secretion system F family protein [archaeon]